MLLMAVFTASRAVVVRQPSTPGAQASGSLAALQRKALLLLPILLLALPKRVPVLSRHTLLRLFKSRLSKRNSSASSCLAVTQSQGTWNKRHHTTLRPSIWRAAGKHPWGAAQKCRWRLAEPSHMRAVQNQPLLCLRQKSG